MKFLASIAAALAVAYFNIKIPNLLGQLVNTLSKYISSGTPGGQFDSSTFLGNMKGPAMGLFSMYAAQVSCRNIIVYRLQYLFFDFQSLFTFIYILLLSQIGEQMAAKLRQDLFKQIIIQDLSFFDENRTGELVNRSADHIKKVRLQLHVRSISG
jgi:ATP-binding cassette, subfamily B (MDR/TAP), member 8